MEPVTMLIAGVLALIAILRSPRISAPQLVAPLALHWTLPSEDEEEGGQPARERRAPHLLLWAVVCVAVLRAVVFLALGT